jgi:C-terminal processing protease CtpA/Prc
VDEVRTTLEGGGVSRVIVDLRHNPGGDNQTYGPLLELLQDPTVDRPGRLLVIIGRQTFSASANFATELDRLTSAVFVGEPTGGRPNLYGDVRAVELPSSGITVEVSSRYWEMSTPDDDRPWIPPDIPVELTSVDYFAHRDPILDAALAA